MLKIIDPGTDLVLSPFSPREIRYAFHDIDGTHSLIRDWPPVMSICLQNVILHGLPEDFDSEGNRRRLIQLAGLEPHPETDRFCVESAGLSALTQMEWAIRRGVQEGSVAVDCHPQINAKIIDRIWAGNEYSEDLPETEAMAQLLREKTPRLFKLYEAVLNGYCRDRNLEEAKKHPEKFIIPGSMAFMKFLHDHGVKNYFVTGAVVEKGMGMHEEVETLGYPIGPGCLVEDIIGSTWTQKLPKDKIMEKLLQELGARGEEVLVVGDGRAEISAGVHMGALVISRLPASAQYQRQLHRTLGSHLILEDYRDPRLAACFPEASCKFQ